ncbi:hypothetical protein LX32DRAFT_165953 [Colletotrichum zoysiae]|uniref:Uncharacterized protein n=1 Tax=Colletotrichum zoysiae TaxID=1216348 RepID=A0AAD9H692_9PEZI|nr:hypothetical protein LX32DRAFT_165953 [Colletotrichum zoysiae]
MPMTPLSPLSSPMRASGTRPPPPLHESNRPGRDDQPGSWLPQPERCSSALGRHGQTWRSCHGCSAQRELPLISLAPRPQGEPRPWPKSSSFFGLMSALSMSACGALGLHTTGLGETTRRDPSRHRR